MLLAVASIALVVLAFRHRELRGRFLDHRRADMRAQAGNYVPAFTGSSSGAGPVNVGEPVAGGRQVVILLTSACPFCRETLPAWKRIAAALSASHERVQIVALTTDSIRAAKSYADSNQLPFPLLSFPSRRIAWMYRGAVVPQTFVIDEAGRVLLARHGVVNTTEAIDSIVAVAITGGDARTRAGAVAVADSVSEGSGEATGTAKSP